MSACRATCFQQHQKRPRSEIAIATCEVQVYINDFQIRSNCSHWSLEAAVLRCNSTIYVDQCEPSVIHRFITFYWSLNNYAAHAAYTSF